MDFFDQQDQARKATRRLAWLFLLSLFVLAVLMNAGFFFLGYLYYPHFTLHNYIMSPVCFWTTLAALLMFASGSVRRFHQLKHNNLAVAELVNATEIDLTTAASDEKQLINVVEEMAVASGMPPPRLFVMREEYAINAFVAGHIPNHIMVVTQGTIEKLNRNELQGMIGHEFAHLANGDAILNVRMLAWLAGLLSVGRIGKYLIDLANVDHENGSGVFLDPRQNRSNGVIAPIFMAGIVLYLAGFAGLFLGRLIKAAISRQREALADAGSRQFTRSPDGLAGALIKIKHHGSVLSSRFAEDVSHMCFGNGITTPFAKWLATHPDIDTRLRNIDPTWIARARVRKQKLDSKPTQSRLPTSGNLGYAESLISMMPESLMQQIHTPNGALLVTYALLMDVSQQKFLPAIDGVERGKLPSLAEKIAALGSRTRLPLIDLVVPALMRLSIDDKRTLLNNIDWLIKADGQVTLTEFLLREAVRQRLITRSEVPMDVTRMERLAPQVQLLLSTLIYTSASDANEQQQLFKQFAAPLLPPGRQLLPLQRCALQPLVNALKELNRLTPLNKKSLLFCCADIIVADRKIQVEEAELLRLVCILLDSPIPPLNLP